MTGTLGIDLGGTNARAAWVDRNGKILHSEKLAHGAGEPEAVIRSIAEVAKKVLAQAGKEKPDGIGLGVAGQLDMDKGVVQVAPNLGWRNVPVGQMLEDALGAPVRVVNDLSAAAWGELHAGAGKGASDLLVVFVGSGVGGAMISHGRLVNGASGVAGEFGHVKVVPGGRRCGCGELGCLEAYAGGHNLIAQISELINSGASKMLRQLSNTSSGISPALLEEAAKAGDHAAHQLYERVCGFLGLAVANQVTMLNPKRVVLGGGVLLHCPGFRKAIVDGVDQYSSRVSFRSVDIVDAALGDDSGLIGAALLACHPEEPA